MTAVASNRYACFGGGYTARNTYSSAIDIYDAEQNSWKNFQTAIRSRGYGASGSSGSAAIWVGGLNATSTTVGVRFNEIGIKFLLTFGYCIIAVHGHLRPLNSYTIQFNAVRVSFV